MKWPNSSIEIQFGRRDGNGHWLSGGGLMDAVTVHGALVGFVLFAI